MKLIISTLLFFIAASTYGQHYKTSVAEANGFYERKEYQKSVDKFREAFKTNQQNAGDFYNAACAAALLGNKELAFKWLERALKNGWTNIDHLQTDSDLTSLHDHKKWNNFLMEMRKAANKKEVNYNKPLQARLLAIYNDDQPIRQQYISAEEQFGHKANKLTAWEK